MSWYNESMTRVIDSSSDDDDDDDDNSPTKSPKAAAKTHSAAYVLQNMMRVHVTPAPTTATLWSRSELTQLKSASQPTSTRPSVFVMPGNTRDTVTTRHTGQGVHTTHRCLNTRSASVSTEDVSPDMYREYYGLQS